MLMLTLLKVSPDVYIEVFNFYKIVLDLYNFHFPAFGLVKDLIRFFSSKMELERTLQSIL